MDIDQLKHCFEEHFECKPKYIVQCPGRVNLIGEHTDYSGYDVLPMAINVTTTLLVSERDQDEIAFHNLNEEYSPYTFKLNEQWIGIEKLHWYHYLLSGWKGILDRLELKPRGMNVLLYGTIPPSAGLSSSSSMVCASALATLALHTGKTFELISQVEFAELCAKVERYVGMEGGGMDQAIEVLATEGAALRIQFDPLRFWPVYLPKRALFAVIHSERTHNKAANSQYNQRVVECRLAAQIIAKHKISGDSWQSIRTLRQLAEKLNKNIEQMLTIVDEVLQLPVYTRDEALKLLEISDEQFKRLILTPNTQDSYDFIEFKKNVFAVNEFKLMQRARHVFSEAQRVEQFELACKQNDLKQMANLMNQSHQSCRNLYECSCDELDDTVAKCLANGALGARLTGAGWGGCVVALFDTTYGQFDVLFASRPVGGIRLIL